MCGIVGYVGFQDCPLILLDALKRLEYRGYDSAGIAVIQNGRLLCHRTVGKLINLERLLLTQPVSGHIGIGHTRWATHGAPSEINAHPHVVDKVAVVHNGIIENYVALRQELEDKGTRFSSQTDTEVIAQLIALYLKEGNSFEEAVCNTIARLEGSFALGILCADEPETLIAVRQESPLILGFGEGEYFIASDAPALLPYTKKVHFMNDGEMAVITPTGVTLKDFSGNLLPYEVTEIPWSPLLAEKAGYKHFMQKEIFEQPRAIIDTFRGRIYPNKGEVVFEEFNLSQEEIKEIEKIWIVACGTSWHAGLVGKYMLERLCRIPVEVDLGSEFRYRDPIVNKKMLLVLISQSGETADTLAAMREGKRKGAKTLAICNVLGSTIARECDYVIYTHAGPEIGVASTKAFTTQLTVLYLLTLYFAKRLGKLDEMKVKEYLSQLMVLPGKIEKILDDTKSIEELAIKYSKVEDFLYLGRGVYFPIALEGALKLKEISYIHAEAYAAGEMKHGPIALIDENMPVVILAPKGETFEKIRSNMEEVLSRKGRVIALTEPECQEIAAKAEDTIFIPPLENSFLKAILLTVPLQLLAYYIAVFRGTDIDQPRNLAKSVTVE